MFDLQNWSPVLLVCLAGCGIGVLVVAGIFFRIGVNIFTDVIGGIAGTQRARLPAPPPRPTFSPAPRAQSAPPPMSFDEALARRQGLSSAGQGFPPQPQGFPPQAQGFPPQAQGFPPQPQGFPPQPQGFPPQAQGFPPTQPAVGGRARPSLSQGVPYRPSAGLPPVGAPPSFGTPNNPFDERRRQRRLQDDRYEIYTDEDDAGGGLDMLL